MAGPSSRRGVSVKVANKQKNKAAKGGAGGSRRTGRSSSSSSTPPQKRRRVEGGGRRGAKEATEEGKADDGSAEHVDLIAAALLEEEEGEEEEEEDEERVEDPSTSSVAAYEAVPRRFASVASPRLPVRRVDGGGAWQQPGLVEQQTRDARRLEGRGRRTQRGEEEEEDEEGESGEEQSGAQDGEERPQSPSSASEVEPAATGGHERLPSTTVPPPSSLSPLQLQHSIAARVSAGDPSPLPPPPHLGSAADVFPSPSPAQRLRLRLEVAEIAEAVLAQPEKKVGRWRGAPRLPCPTAVAPLTRPSASAPSSPLRSCRWWSAFTRSAPTRTRSSNSWRWSEAAALHRHLHAPL